MNAIVDDKVAESASVKVSDRAAAKIAGLIQGASDSTAFRVTVEGGGCSGFQYRFDLVDTVDPDDLVVEKSGAIVVVDPISLPYMLGSEIDLSDDLMGESLEVNNPLAVTSCGCGTSFSL